MWDLDDKTKYKKLCEFEIDKIYTWGSTNDMKRREEIRQKACGNNLVPRNKSYAFRISIYIYPQRKPCLDIDNVPKLILDAFSKNMIEKDNSKYPDCWLYEDDCYPSVKIIEVGVVKEVKSMLDEKVIVEIFECL
jgi:Holliday junction resolvase RusA-like endonuclease